MTFSAKRKNKCFIIIAQNISLKQEYCCNPINEPGREDTWVCLLSVCMSLIASSIIKAYERLFLSVFVLSLHLMHLSETMMKCLSPVHITNHQGLGKSNCCLDYVPVIMYFLGLEVLHF